MASYDWLDDTEGNSDSTAAGLGGVMGAIPGLNIFSPGLTAGLSAGAEADRRAKMLKVAKQLGLPEFSDNDYGTVDYEGDLAPKLYGSPEEAKAELAHMDPATLKARMAALSDLEDAGTGYGSKVAEAQRREALYDAANTAGANNAAIREDMAASGRGGGGAEMALRQRAGSDAANRAMLGGLQAQASGAQQKLAALHAYEQGLGGLSDDQQALDTHNADIVSQFNMANAALRNQTKMANVNVQNAAQGRNLDARQKVGVANTGIKNSSVDRKDRNAMNKFGAEKDKAGMVTSALGGQAKAANDAGQEGIEAGKVGYSNFKDLMSMFGGGMG